MAKSSIYYKGPRTAPDDVTDVCIPISYFVDHHYLTPGQALSLFLVDEAKLTYTDAALMLQKDEATIRLGYLKAYEKREEHKALRARTKGKRKLSAEL